MVEPNEGPPKRSRIVAAVDITDTPRTRQRTHDADFDHVLGGGFALSSWAVLWGLAGSGKSRCALRWSTHLGRTLWVTHEMPQELVAETARSCGAKLSNLFIAEHAQPDELAQLARDARSNVLGFDSISELDNDGGLELLDTVRRWVTGGPRIAIVICHETKDGDYRGPSTIGHAPDYLLRTAPSSDGCAVAVKKSRFCAQGACVCPLLIAQSSPRPKRGTK